MLVIFYITEVIYALANTHYNMLFIGNCFEKTTFYFDGVRDNSDKAHFCCELVYWTLRISY